MLTILFFLFYFPGDWSCWLCTPSVWGWILELFSWNPSKWYIEGIRCKLFWVHSSKSFTV